MDQQKKLLATAFLTLAILIVIFLASGISGMEFQPGTIAEREAPPIEFRPLAQSNATPLWPTILIILISVTLSISIVIFIKYPEVRRRTYLGLVYFLIFGFVLFATRGKSEEAAELSSGEEEILDTAIIQTQREAAEFISAVGDIDPTLNLILDIAIVLLVGLLAFFIYRRFFKNPLSASEQLKADAEEALSEIQLGEDLRNIIIRCYTEMSQVLNEQRGIQRQQAMTPREFERQLQDIGLPQNSIERLTRLFEEARYGHSELGKEAEQEAIQCLTAIAEAC